jgi:hypothetical protein
MLQPDHEQLLGFLNEFAFWYQQMGQKGELPRALSGFNAAGEQFVIRLDGVALSHKERHGLIRTILSQEQAICYAYGGLMKPAETTDEQLTLIVATSGYYLVADFELIQGGEVLLEQRDLWEGDNPAEVPSAWFLTDAIEVTDADRQRYQNIWQELRHQAMFLQRPVVPDSGLTHE